MRGLNTKLRHVYLSSISTYPEYDVLLLAETWLSPAVYDSEILSEEYHILRCDRGFARTGVSRGGGVLAASRRDIAYSTLDLTPLRLLFPLIDIVAFKMITKQTIFVLAVVYFPPQTSAGE